jgi:hypothetical protein
MDLRRPIPHPPPEDSEFSDFPPIRIGDSADDPPNTQSVTRRSRYRSSTVQNHSEHPSSDFPPIRIHDSTPDPPNTQSVTSHSRYHSSTVENHPSSPSQLPGPQLPRPSRRLPKKPVLGHKNIINTVEVTVQHTDVSLHSFLQMVLLNNDVLQKATKSLSKRRLEPLDSVDNNHRLKRQCLDLQDDVNWMKVEITDIKAYMRDIKTCMREIAEHLQGDVDYKLEEIIDRLRQLELSVP